MTPLGATILYAAFALGAVAVYLSFPGGRASARTAGLIFALAAIAGLVTLVAGRMLPVDRSTSAFCVFAATAVFGAGKVITHAKPVYSAVYFILVVTAVACLMVLQEAEFLGIALIIVYAGAILVTYVFVIMLAQQSGASAVDANAREPLAAVLVGFMIMAVIAGRIADLPSGGAGASRGVYPRALEPADGDRSMKSAGVNPAARPSNTAEVGAELLSRYVVALEISGVLLLVAMIGAIVMAQKRVPLDVPREESPAPGEIGKAVAPF